MSYKLAETELIDLINVSYSNKDASAFSNVDGYLVYNSVAEMQETIRNFEVFDDDVWVATFPRSGTTWTQEMVWCLMNNLNFEAAAVEIDARFPFLEKDCIRKANNMAVTGSFTAAKQMARPRLIKTHLPWELLPEQIRSKKKNPKIIYGTRDPRDVCVSFYHQNKMIHGFNNEFRSYCKLFLNNKILWTPFNKHLEGYMKQQNNSNILCIQYEEMQANLKQVIHAVANFLEVTVDNNEVIALADHISFDKMKDNPSVNREHITTTGNFMRRGKTGTYKLEMDEDMISQFDEWMRDNDL